MNIRHVFVILFLIGLIDIIKANESPDSLFAILKNEKQTVEERIGKAGNSVHFNELLKSESDFLRFCSIAEKWYQNAPETDKLFLITFIKCDWFYENNKIGELLVEADKFKSQASIKNTKTDNIRSLTLYDRAYNKLGLFEEWAETSKKLYHLQKDEKNTDLKIAYLSSYCWTLNNCGFYLKDKKLLDSCIYYHDLARKMFDLSKLPWNTVLNLNTINILALKRAKKYHETIDVTNNAISLAKKNIPDPKQLNDALATFYGSLAYAKFHLGETDSALYYSELSLTKNENIVNLSEGIIYFLAKMGKYKEATIRLKPYIFGDKKNKSPNTFSYHCGFAAPIFEKAEMFKEAAYCYHINKIFSDSIRKLENATHDEFNRVNMKLIIDSERKSAQLASEKITLENEKEKEKKNMIIIAGIIFTGIVIVFLFIVYRRYKLTQKQNAIIESQKNILVSKNEIIEEKHKEITDSINYAERIQRSFLATQQHLDSNLHDYFILFKPKAVVSGDFYWSATLDNGHFALATADSTGHGVPGAIMSLLNITSLEKAIETFTKPSDILNATREIIIDRLKRDGSEEGGKDGMDCSLCVYDFKNMKLHIASAHNPVWIIRGSEIIEIKPDKMPVGKHDRDTISFNQQEIDLQTGDVVYTLTDGFPDQFGGEKGKKFMNKNLRDLLSKNSHLTMQEQKQFLEKTFADWIGNFEQVDDVTIIGVRI